MAWGSDGPVATQALVGSTTHLPSCVCMYVCLICSKGVSVRPFGYAYASLYASEHVKQRALVQESTRRQSISTSPFTSSPPPRKHRARAPTGSRKHFHEILTRAKASSQTRVHGKSHTTTRDTTTTELLKGFCSKENEDHVTRFQKSPSFMVKVRNYAPTSEGLQVSRAKGTENRLSP
jgi:hypothetical protein